MNYCRLLIFADPTRNSCLASILDRTPSRPHLPIAHSCDTSPQQEKSHPTLRAGNHTKNMNNNNQDGANPISSSSSDDERYGSASSSGDAGDLDRRSTSNYESETSIGESDSKPPALPEYQDFSHLSPIGPDGRELAAQRSEGGSINREPTFPGKLHAILASPQYNGERSLFSGINSIIPVSHHLTLRLLHRYHLLATSWTILENSEIQRVGINDPPHLFSPFELQFLCSAN